MVLHYPKLHAALLPLSPTPVRVLHLSISPVCLPVFRSYFFSDPCFLFFFFFYNFPGSVFTSFVPLVLKHGGTQQARGATGIAPVPSSRVQRQATLKRHPCLLVMVTVTWMGASIALENETQNPVFGYQAQLMWLGVLCSEPRLLPLCLRTWNVYHLVAVIHVL